MKNAFVKEKKMEDPRVLKSKRYLELREMRKVDSLTPIRYITFGTIIMASALQLFAPLAWIN